MTHFKFVKIPERGYEFQTTQVTQKTWTEIMVTDPSYFKGDGLPVETVSWFDCQDFIKKLNDKKDGHVYRLPTEEEWEHACRAGSKNDYCFGNDVSKLGEYAWYFENSENKTHPVAQKKANDFGLYDMHGNVWELCEDNDGSCRVLRGGSWSSIARSLRSAYRINGTPDARYYNVGFRLVRTAVPLGSITLDSLSAERAKLGEAIKMLQEIYEKLGKK